jgi:hypothetical protein
VLRTIPSRVSYYDCTLPDPVNRFAFEPAKRDTDGLSLFRLDFISARNLARRSKNKNGVYVARLRVRDIVTEGFTVEPKIDPDIPGHVVVPELSYANYKKNKAQLQDRVLALAKLAGQEIVVSPG